MTKKIIAYCVALAQQHQQKPKSGIQQAKLHYSFIIQDNAVISWATNRFANPLVKFGYALHSQAHSETEAYRKAKPFLKPNKSFKCINIRLNKSGELSMSKPCKCCHNFLHILNCSAVAFSTEVGFAKMKLI